MEEILDHNGEPSNRKLVFVRLGLLAYLTGLVTFFIASFLLIKRMKQENLRSAMSETVYLSYLTYFFLLLGLLFCLIGIIRKERSGMTKNFAIAISSIIVIGMIYLFVTV